MELILCILEHFAYFFCCLLICQISIFLKNSFRNAIRVTTKLDPSQAQHHIRPDLGPNWVQTVCKSYEQTSLVGKELKIQNDACSVKTYQ